MCKMNTSWFNVSSLIEWKSYIIAVTCVDAHQYSLGSAVTSLSPWTVYSKDVTEDLHTS